MRLKLGLALVLLLNTVAANASNTDHFLRPINLDSAYINTTNKNEIRAGFDFLRDGDDGFSSQNTYNLTTKYKRAFDTKVPTRASVGLGLSLINSESVFGFDQSELDFSNLLIGLEAAPLNKESLAMSFYFDQSLPTGSDIGYLNPLGDSYAFHVGTRYQVKLLDHLSLFGDLSFNKAFSFDDDSEFSYDYFSYINELVLDTGSKFNPTVAFASSNIINSSYDSGDPFFVIPGAIIPFGEDNKYQARIGVPIGLADAFYDIGVQASFFTIF